MIPLCRLIWRKKRRFAKTGRLYFECSQVLFYYRQPVYNWPKALWWPTAWLVWLLHLDSPELETTFYALCAAVYEQDGWMWLYLQSNENWRWEVSSQARAVKLARKQPTTIIWFLHISDYCTFIAQLWVCILQKFKINWPKCLILGRRREHSSLHASNRQ